MQSFNRVVLMGNLTRDIELRYTPSGKPTALLGLAMNHKWTDQQGQKREEVTFIDCQVWGATAENAQKYLSKGAPVHIEGRLKHEIWNDKATGGKRQKIIVVVEQLIFLNRAPAREDQAQPSQ